jgi:TP901 family phage tail tape measure protein
MANNDSKASFKVYLDFQTTGKSIKDVDAEFKKLNNTIRRDLVPGTKAYNDAVAKQRELGKVLDDHKAKVKGVGGVWQSLSKEVKAFGMIALGAIGFQAITGQMGNMIRRAADLSDAYANVQKTTGLTANEVEALAKELGKIDTRTSRMELLKLASEAGKLGITGAGNIKKFVKEADMINVALGEDLGEGALLSIGKLSDVFGTGMLNIGSAINSLGAASAASEGYLVDFAARLGGIAKTAGISAPDILGYGAVLDSLGLQAEMSSTALSNFFIDFTKNTSKFEAAAGMAKGSLDELIGKEGSNAGFLAFLENLKASSSGADDFLRKLEKLGIDGSRGAQVFLTLSNNIGMVKDQQKIANTEFEKGTSIINEFNVKNETFAAKLEKLQKTISRLLTDNALVNGIKSLVIALVDNMDGISNAFSKATAPISRYIDKVGELFRGIGILLQKTELGNKVLSYAATVWGFVAKGVGLVYDGLVGLINGFERAIATAAGVKAGFEALVEYFRTTVKQAFDGIAEMISGVFSLDASKIKKGTAVLAGAFSTLGKTVADSFIDSYNKTMKVFQPVPKAKVDMSVTGNKSSSVGNVDFSGTGNSNSTLDQVEEKVKRIKQQAIELKTLLPTIDSEIAEPAMKAIIPLDSLSDAPFSTPEDAPKTDEEWDELKNKASESLNTISTIGNGVISIIDNVSARQQDELNEFLNIQERKKNALNDLYENGKLSAEDYNKKVRALDQESANKQREFAQKQARRQKVAAIFDSVINTARAVVAALPNIPLSVAVGAIGTINTGLIAGRPIPQFAEGGSTFKNGGPVVQPRLGLIGEAGPEWVAPNWMLRDPATADVIGALEKMRRDGPTPFYKGGLTKRNREAFSDFQESLSNKTGVQIGLDKVEAGQQQYREYLYIKGIFELVAKIANKESKSAIIKWKDGDTRELAEKQTRYDEILEDNSIR